MHLPELGIGITYSSRLDPLLDLNPDLIDVLEIEPQTHWFHTRKYTDPYRIDEKMMDRIKSYKYHKIVHGVNTPVGGSTLPDPKQIPLFLKMVTEFNSPWASEHLSFNIARINKREFKTAFSLPPRQTMAGVKTAVRSIRSLADQLAVPFAVENGVNYLRTRKDELTNGEFISRVIEYADCGLVLDLHNAWTNEVNGRQKVFDFLRQIPFERIWELHVAGGREEEGFYLDSHSGEITESLIQILRKLIPRLSHLRAIIFEISPSYLDVVDNELIYEQLIKLRQLWGIRNTFPISDLPSNAKTLHIKSTMSDPVEFPNRPTPAEWENVLGALVIGQIVEGDMANELSSDPGLRLLKRIVFSNRASMLVKSLKLTIRLLMLSLGAEQFKLILQDYFKEQSPEFYATTEGENFVCFILKNKQFNIPYLEDILKLELAIISVIVYGKAQEIQFQYDPRPILDALLQRKKPDSSQPGSFEVAVTSDGLSISQLTED